MNKNNKGQEESSLKEDKKKVQGNESNSSSNDPKELTEMRGKGIYS